MMGSFLISAAYAADAAGAEAGHHLPWYLEAETYVAVAFVLLVVFAWKPVKRSILGSLDGRAARIKADLDEAARLRAEASAMADEAQRKHQAALKDAADIVATAREEAERMRKKAERDLADSIARRETQARDRIAQAEQAAIDEVRARAVEIAVTAAGELTSEALKGSAGAASIDRAIQEIDKSAA